MESKLNCQNHDYKPLVILLRALNCLVPWRIHRQNCLFFWKPNVDKYFWIRTISRGENWREAWIRPRWRFSQHEHFSGSRSPHCFHVLLISGLLPLFLQMLVFCYVSDIKIHTSEQHLTDLGSHFLKMALGPSVCHPNSYWYIDLAWAKSEAPTNSNL